MTFAERRKTLVLATGNPDKVAEFDALLKDKGWIVRPLKDLAGDADIDESGMTLKENAAIKARFVHKLTGQPALADDTGLEVDALDGRPGVYSARYAGPGCSASDNRKKLLDELAGVTDPDTRSARFRTVIAFVDDSGEEFFEGVCEGRIVTEERGEGGFGYDPVFRPDHPDGKKMTFSEMDSDTKNRISHRGRALQSFLKRFP